MSIRYGFVGWLLVGVSSVGCRQAATLPPVAPIVNSNYLLVYGLAATQDELHPIKVQGPDGRTWYRETVPGLDLTYLLRESVFAVTPPVEGKECEVVSDIGVPLFAERFRDWTRARIGQDYGIMINGRVVTVGKVYGEVNGRASFRFPSFEDATRVAQAIRAGGAETMSTSRPAETRPATTASQVAKDAG